MKTNETNIISEDTRNQHLAFSITAEESMLLDEEYEVT